MPQPIMKRLRLPSASMLPPAAVGMLQTAFHPQLLDTARIQDHGHLLDTLVLRLTRASALTLGRRIIARPGALDPDTPAGLALLAHELVHVRQFREHGAVRFLIRYVGEYLRGRCRGLGHWAAYREISFEREAHAIGREIAARRSLGPPDDRQSLPPEVEV